MSNNLAIVENTHYKNFESKLHKEEHQEPRCLNRVAIVAAVMTIITAILATIMSIIGTLNLLSLIPAGGLAILTIIAKIQAIRTSRDIQKQLLSKECNVDKGSINLRNKCPSKATDCMNVFEVICADQDWRIETAPERAKRINHNMDKPESIIQDGIEVLNDDQLEQEQEIHADTLKLSKRSNNGINIHICDDDNIKKINTRYFKHMHQEPLNNAYRENEIHLFIILAQAQNQTGLTKYWGTNHAMVGIKIPDKPLVILDPKHQLTKSFKIDDIQSIGVGLQGAFTVDCLRHSISMVTYLINYCLNNDINKEIYIENVANTIKEKVSEQASINFANYYLTKAKAKARV